MANALSQRAKLGIGLGAAAVVAAALFASHPFGPRVPTTPDEVAALMSDSPMAARMLPAFKQTFPDEYNRMMMSEIGYMKARMPADQVRAATFKQMQGFVAGHVTDVARAPDAALLALARARGALLNGADETLCARTVAGSLTAAENPSAVAQPLIADAAAANFRAARAGMDSPTQRPTAPSPADSQALASRLRAHGLTDAQLGLLAGGTLPTAAPADQCTVGRAIFAALADLPPPQAARIMAVMAKAG